MQRPSSLIKVEGSTSSFRESYLGESRECCVEVNVDNQSKSLSDNMIILKRKRVEAKIIFFVVSNISKHMISVACSNLVI